MTDRELIQQALDALELVTDLTSHDDEVYEAIEALRARLAQPEQEPVAWMHTTATGDIYFRKKPHDRAFSPQPVYAAPPRREWQGLTDEEIWEIFCDARLEPEQGWLWNGRAIEAKLKEKNT